MTKVQELARRNAILGGVAVVLVLYLVFRPSTTSAVSTEQLPALLPNLTLDAVREVTLSREASKAVEGQEPANDEASGTALAGANQESIQLVQRKEGEWVIPSKGDYPADKTKVEAFLQDLVGAKIKKVVTERSGTFSEYAGTDGWTKVVIAGSDKPLATFWIGKSAEWPDSYVKRKVGGKEQVIRAYNLRSNRARIGVTDWVEARLWPGLTMDDVQRIDLFQKDEKKTLSFERAPEEEKPSETEPKEGEGEEGRTKAPDTPQKPAEIAWTMLAPQSGDAKKTAVENVIRSFTGMRLKDVLADANGVDTGLDDPAYRVVVRLRVPQGAKEGTEGERRVLLVGREMLDAEGKGTDTWTVKKADDDHVYLVATSSIADFRLPVDEYLPKKEGAVKDAAGAEGPGGDGTASPGEGEGTPGEKPAEGSPDGQAPGKPAEGSPDGEVPAPGGKNGEGASPPPAPPPPAPPAPPAPPGEKDEDAPGGG